MNIEAGRLYTNIKTGRVYKVLHIAAAAWDTNQVLAVCQDVEQTVWVRSLTEFREKFKEQQVDTHAEVCKSQVTH